MKNCKPSGSISTVLFLVLICCARSGSAAESDIPIATEISTILVHDDLNQVVRSSKERDWHAPRIDSAWYVETHAPKEERISDVKMRSLGKLLEEQISSRARVLMEARGIDDLESGVETLIALANWLDSTEGYGNLLLAAHCRDVATVGIGKLMIRADYPFEKSVNLLASFTSPTPTVRARILNHEAGAQLFSTDSRHTLEEIWRSGEILCREQQHPDLKAARLGKPPTGLEEFSQFMQKFNPSIIDSASIQSNLSFFQDDDASTINGPPTLANTWDRKRHMEIVNGVASPNIAPLKALAKFRSTVGSFPLEPVKHPFYKGGEAAFDKAWRPHAAKDEYNLGLLAWRAYDEIQTREFWDKDTRMLNLEPSEKTTSGK